MYLVRDRVAVMGGSVSAIAHDFIVGRDHRGLLFLNIATAFL